MRLSIFLSKRNKVLVDKDTFVQNTNQVAEKNRFENVMEFIHNLFQCKKAAYL